MAQRPAGDAPRGPDRVRRPGDAGRRLLGGQPHLLLALHLDARARGRRDPRGRARSGDGPPEFGAQVARRAGIAASEMRGTYEGLWLLDRADQHASSAPRPEEQLAKTASIRAEMHLDAGEMQLAEAEAKRALEPRPGRVDQPPGHPHARRRLRLAGPLRRGRRRPSATPCPARTSRDERWIDLSARTLLARIALEQGRIAEAVAAARAVVLEARELAEDRVGAARRDAAARHSTPRGRPRRSAGESLPWAVRLPVLAQDGRDLLARGEPDRRPAWPPTSSPSPTRPAWAATASRPGSCSVARWSSSATSTRPPRPTSPPSSTAARCTCRCGPPTCSTAWPASPAPASCRRRGRSPRPPSRCARPAWRCAGATPPTTTSSRPAGRPSEWIDGDDLSADSVTLITRRVPPPGRRAALGARHAHRRRAAGRRAGGPRPDQPQDRRGALRLPAHRGRPPDPHLPQARHQHPRPSRGAGDGAVADVPSGCRWARARWTP